MKTTIHNPRGMGALPLEGSTHFRVWAPHANSVSVVGEFNNWDAKANPLAREDDGNWAGEVEGAKAGQQYQFDLTNGDRTFRKNDPYAREIHSKSALSVIYADNYKWKSPKFTVPNWNEMVLDWSKLETFRGISRLYRDLVHLRRNLFGNTKGLTGAFAHVFHVNDTQKLIAFHRCAEGGPMDDVVIVASFSHLTFNDYRIGFPRGGKWLIRFSADWQGYSPDFQGIGNLKDEIVAEKKPYDGIDYSGSFSIGPYGFLVLSQEQNEEKSDHPESAQAPNLIDSICAS
jgi:1,4-alpha-glucan branching enzyme